MKKKKILVIYYKTKSILIKFIKIFINLIINLIFFHLNLYNNLTGVFTKKIKID